MVDPSTGVGDGRNPIELSVRGIESPHTELTRAVITDGEDKTLNGFTNDTRLYLYLKSEDGNQEYGHTKADDLYALTGVSAKKVSTTGQKSEITTQPERQLYWDDAHARDSKLTVYACGYANHNAAKMTFGETTLNWNKDNEPKKIDFQTEAIGTTVAINIDAPATQSSFNEGDFIFSNNIADYHDVVGKTDDRLKYNTDPGENYHKFDKGDLIFYHALSKLTFHVVMGEGFTESEFKFKENTNIALKGFYGKGTFDLVQGEFNTLTDADKKDFSYIAPKVPDLKSRTVNDQTQKYYELNTYVVPGTDIKASTVTDALTLVINNVTYTVSMKTLYDRVLENTANQQDASTVKEAVLTGGTELKAGVNYLFTLTVSKSRIDQITASVTDWKTITTSELTPSNAKVSLDLEERGEDFADDTQIAVYRASESSAAYNWTTGYIGNSNTMLKTSGKWNLTGGVWFWPDNNTYYHFRAIMPTGETVVKDATANVDYVALTSAAVGTKDVCWGAPMRDDQDDEVAGSFKWTYNFTNGFGVNNAALSDKNQIHEAIGATTATLKYTLFHMMSEIKVTLTNTGTNVPLLTKNANHATVELLNFKNGRLLLGNGLVQTTGDAINQQSLPKETDAYIYKYCVVPQDLSNVKLRIVTPDDNVYLVNLKDAIANTNTSDGGAVENLTSTNIANPYQETAPGSKKYKINQWYPGFQYEYTINLTLKGIDDVGVKLVDWTSVKMDETGIQIK